MFLPAYVTLHHTAILAEKGFRNLWRRSETLSAQSEKLRFDCPKTAIDVSSAEQTQHEKCLTHAEPKLGDG